MDLIELFLRGCVVSERRQRILFELSKPKKYVNAISRFAHDAKSIIVPRSVVSIVNSEQIPGEYFKGELLILTLYKRENIEGEPEWARRFVSDEYGPIIVISSLGTALVKDEDNEIMLLRFKV